jgi:hypothetical protein
MRRRTYIEQIRRLVYGGQPDDDAEITVGLVNVWLQQAIAYAAKKNYTDSLSVDGIAYVNNSFYTTYKNLPVTADEQFLWKITLPEIPLGIGQTEGISTVKFKDFESRQLSFPVVLLSQNQLSFQRGMRTIPNKILAYSEGNSIYVMSELILNDYTAQVTMVSGGDSTDLDSEINVPNDYFPVMTEYLRTQLMLERSVPKDVTPDGNDAIKFT